MKNRSPARDTGCCSPHFLKYLLFIFNFLFYIAGVGILGVGIWTLFWKSHYAILLSSNWYVIITYILISAGLLVVLGGLFGCCGLFKENRCCLFMFALVLLVIFVAEAAAGALAYIYQDRVGQELKDNLEMVLMKEYSVDDRVTMAADRLMKEHKCCGANSFMDWRNIESAWYQNVNIDPATNKTYIDRHDIVAVPDVCCITVTEDCGKKDHPSNIYYDGCMQKLRDVIRKHELIIGAIALGICNIQLFGFIITCCLFCKFKDYIPVKAQQKSRRQQYYDD